MTITEEILTIANTLADQGKKPSIALVKTQLSHAVPLPTLISVLKSWQHQPNYQAKNKLELPQKRFKNNDTKQEIQQAIAQALAPIQLELNEIKQLLIALTTNK